jgi:hypothetical protein
MKAKPRDDAYTAGEKLTTHALTYMKIPTRNLAEPPRMTAEARAKTHGASSAPVYTQKAVLNAIKNGVPIAWREVMPIQLYVTFYNHFDIKSVCDLSPGPGAAAIAALQANIPYTGLCQNQEHAAWLNKIVDNAYFAILTDGAKDRDKEQSDRLLHFFGPIVEDAKRMLRAEVIQESGTAGAAAESDDSAA